MNLCSMVIHARPEKLPLVRADLDRRDGVEVHAESEDGKLVVTVEHPDRGVYSETMMQMHNVNGVLTAALIYEYNDGEELSQKEVSQ